MEGGEMEITFDLEVGPVKIVLRGTGEESRRTLLVAVQPGAE
jgi:hypothetical protein